MRLLLVEDEPHAAQLLAKGLREHTYAVDVATDGTSAVFSIGVNTYDAVILDVMLPGQDGFAVCRTVRASGSMVPILMLTARDAVDARIHGLDCGADDYLTKPYALGELLARLRSIIRRGSQPLLPERLTVGRLVLETRSRQVFVDDWRIVLTAREYALLEYLARCAGQVVTRTDIAEHVWDEHYDPASNVVDVYVQRLRKKLGASGALSVIRTRRGQGYELSGDPAD